MVNDEGMRGEEGKKDATLCKDTWKNAIFHLIDYCCLDRQKDKVKMCNLAEEEEEQVSFSLAHNAACPSVRPICKRGSPLLPVSHIDTHSTVWGGGVSIGMKGVVAVPDTTMRRYSQNPARAHLTPFQSL
ncbi:hypothetical protein PO909_002823 [Leuciscus waleckii]